MKIKYGFSRFINQWKLENPNICLILSSIEKDESYGQHIVYTVSFAVFGLYAEFVFFRKYKDCN